MSPAACPYVVPFLSKEPDLYRERAYFPLFVQSGGGGFSKDSVLRA
jgi:hypothetical protein